MAESNKEVRTTGFGKLGPGRADRFRDAAELRFSVTPAGGTPLSFPVTGPTGAVRGFSLAPDAIPTQEVVDRVATKFQAFCDALAPEEQAVVTALLAQAVELSEQAWPV